MGRKENSAADWHGRFCADQYRHRPRRYADEYARVVGRFFDCAQNARRVEDLRQEHVLDFVLAELARGVKFTTIVASMSAVSAFFKFLQENGLEVPNYARTISVKEELLPALALRRSGRGPILDDESPAA